MTDRKRPLEKTPWRPPTRRAFVAMLAAAASTLVVQSGTRLLPGAAHNDTLRYTPSGKTRWIGHC